MSTDRHPLTVMPRVVWPAILGQARATVAAHDDGGECALCPAYPGRLCPRLVAAQRFVADPQMLAAEQEARG